MADKPVKKPTKIESLSDQINQLTEALQRERADVTNIRRRHEEEKNKLSGYYKSMIVTSFLPVVDNFDRSLKHIPTELAGNNFVKGITGIVKQFEDILTSLGVKKIETVGQEFNPIYHEAVSVEGNEGDHEIIVEELQSGYKIDDEIIRPAMVKVKRQNSN